MNYNKMRATWWSGTCYHKEQLDMIIANTDVKNYAHILHDKDISDDGTLKKAHYHFLIQLQQKQRGSWFKQFASDDMGIVFAEPSFAPEGAYNYLIHDTPPARKRGKYLYDPSERTSTIENFEVGDEKTDENAELWADIIDLVDGKITWYYFIQKKPKRIHMISNIKNAYAMIYFERYGKHFFDINQRPPFKKHETTQCTPSPKYKVEHSTGELIPITDPKELANMPF